MTYSEKCRLIDSLGIADAQNHPANENQDHMTICGFFTTLAQFEAHAAKLHAKAARWDAEGR